MGYVSLHTERWTVVQLLASSRTLIKIGHGTSYITINRDVGSAMAYFNPMPRDANLWFQVGSKQSVRLRAGLRRCERYVAPVHDHGQTNTRASIQYRTSSPFHNTTWITILTLTTLVIIQIELLSARLSYISQK